jgi:hypothetical protein
MANEIVKPELQDIARQRKMAEMLLKKGMEDNLQGQMVSGRYVGASPWQGIANMYSAYAGGELAKEADKKAEAYAQKLREQKAVEAQDIMDALTGKEAYTKQVQATETNLPQGQTMLDDQGQRTLVPQRVEATKANPQLALAKALKSETDVGQTLLPALVKQVVPEDKYQVVAPGGALVDRSGKVIYQAPFKPSGDGFGSGGGGFNKKGEWVTANNAVIGKTEIAKDREVVKTANELRQGLEEITPQDVKKTATVFGDVSQGGFKGYLAKQFGSDAVSAQNKINASAVMQTLQNLPPGPASDKDISQAKSSFPGYGDEKALNDWIKNTKDMLDRKINNTNQKYGSENWYGATGITTKPAEKKDSGAPSGGPQTAYMGNRKIIVKNGAWVYEDTGEAVK